MHISLFNKYFYKNKPSKLCFEDRVAVLNVIYFLYGGSIILLLSVPSLRGCFSLRAQNSSILQLLMPYALYRAEMIYKSWNAGKNFFIF